MRATRSAGLSLLSVVKVRVSVPFSILHLGIFFRCWSLFWSARRAGVCVRGVVHASRMEASRVCRVCNAVEASSPHRPAWGVGLLFWGLCHIDRALSP